MIISESERNRIKSLYGLREDYSVENIDSNKEISKRIYYLLSKGYDLNMDEYYEGILGKHTPLGFLNIFSKNPKKSIKWYNQDNKRLDDSVVNSKWLGVDVEKETFGVGDFQKFQDFVYPIIPNSWDFVDNQGRFEDFVKNGWSILVRRKKRENL